MTFLLHGEETERLIFRSIDISDFEQWLPFFENPDSFRYWRPLEKTPVEECQDWYSNQFNRYQANRGGMNALIAKEGGKLIGHAGLLVQRVDNKEYLEVAYSLLPEFRGQGFATEAARKCRDIGFSKELAEKLISIISLTNKPSMRVAEKNGMKPSFETVYKGIPVMIYEIKHQG